MLSPRGKSPLKKKGLPGMVWWSGQSQLEATCIGSYNRCPFFMVPKLMARDSQAPKQGTRMSLEVLLLWNRRFQQSEGRALGDNASAETIYRCAWEPLRAGLALRTAKAYAAAWPSTKRAGRRTRTQHLDALKLEPEHDKVMNLSRYLRLGPGSLQVWQTSRMQLFSGSRSLSHLGAA